VRIDLALCLPRDSSSVRITRHVAACALAAVDADPRCLADIELALSEACANVVHHAAAGDEYEVHVIIEDDTCTVTVTDEGVGFGPPEAHAAAMPPADSPRGRGIALMTALVDDVRFEREPNGGTTVRLFKTVRLR
jgi:serine/threonine-protein kinase RsbW